jgi:uncharacterized protein (TIGR00299 family) protein
MSRVLFIDCFSGAAGDMLLGAFLDAGLPEAALRAALGSLSVDHTLEVTRVVRAGVTATKVVVIDRARAHDDHHHHSRDHVHTHAVDEGGHHHGHQDGHRSLAEITHLIGHSGLSVAARARAVSLVTRLAEAEAAIHGIPVDDVHLHEVGGTDSIIDIVGCVFAMEWFGLEEVVASPLNVGGGQITIAHGTFPVPAPATLRLLEGVPVYSEGPAVELVTPTGALVVSGYAHRYGRMPAMTVERIGYGAGTKDFADRPNVVRVVLGRVDARQADADDTRTGVVKIECEIDDMNPQLFGAASDRLFAAGALDVFLTPVQMKKGRPGTLVTVIGAPGQRRALTEVLFRETTTIGVRFGMMEREVLERSFVDVTTRFGSVRMKLAARGGEVISVTPEFDDCVRLSTGAGVPVRTVQADAMRAWMASQSNT